MKNKPQFEYNINFSFQIINNLKTNKRSDKNIFQNFILYIK